MKILITGITGFLGPYLKDEFSRFDENIVLGVARGEGAEFQLDLTNPADVKTMMERINPDLVVHAAAMTNVDQCQKEPPLAWLANVTATRNIVRHIPLRSRLIYISSDMVYSGHGPHSVRGGSENPVNIYGMTKYMGEFEAARFPNHLIIRTNMYGVAKNGRKGASLVDFLLASFRAEAPITVFTDLQFSPIYVETLAEQIRILASTSHTGVMNLAPIGGMSKNQFALNLAARLNLCAAFCTPGISMMDLNRAPRPMDTRMHSSIPMPSMESDLDRLCEAIRKCQPH